MENSPMEPLLVIAVPMWIEKLKHKSFDDFEKRREAILESVCYKGDLLLYGSKKKGETAQLFNDLAEGLAWLALIAKGGVTFGELHWDAEFETLRHVRPESDGPSQPQEMSTVRPGPSEAPEVDADSGRDSSGAEMDRDDDGK